MNVEQQIQNILAVQRELQESQLQQGERLNRIAESTEQNAAAIATLERSVQSLVTVVTSHQDSMEGLAAQTTQLKRAVDYLLSKDGGDSSET
ncbi:MAG: hypothetical protein AAGB01_11845 [Cyanobacteria bacterium P01_F01_bin.42]